MSGNSIKSTAPFRAFSKLGWGIVTFFDDLRRILHRHAILYRDHFAYAGFKGVSRLTWALILRLFAPPSIRALVFQKSTARVAVGAADTFFLTSRKVMSPSRLPAPPASGMRGIEVTVSSTIGIFV